MAIYHVELDPPLLYTDVEAESEDEAIETALRIFQEILERGTWQVRETDE